MSIHHAAVDVTDLGRAADFYGSLLGVERLRTAVDDGGVRNVWYGRDGVPELQFRVVDAVDPGAGGLAHLAVEVADVDAAVARVDPDRVTDRPRTDAESGLRIAFVEDPEGYRVELVGPVE
jgi:lactoylglutathione lyase